MRIFYGKKKITKESNSFIDEGDLFIPIGKNFWKKPLAFLNEISNKVVQGKKIPELFKYSNTSLWWFVQPSINPSVNEAINFIDRFEKMVEEKKINSVEVVGEFDKLTIIKQICEKKRINFHYSKFGYWSYWLIEWSKWLVQPYYYSKITKQKFSKRIKLFKNRIKKTISFDNKIILFSPTTLRNNYYDYENEKNIRGEYPLMSLQQSFKVLGHELVGIDIDYTFCGDPKILQERLNDPICWIPLEIIYEKYGMNIDYSNFIKYFKAIIQTSEFKSMFTYRGVNFWNMVEKDFRKMAFLPFLPSYIKLINAFENFLKIHKPKAFLLPYEKGPLALAVTTVCKKEGTKTIGIQHGGFHILEHIDYGYTNIQSKDNPYGMPIPDITLVWGNAAKKFLIKVGYPAEKLIVLGNPEFFNFDKKLENLKKRDLRKKYGIPKNKKIILFTTGKLQSFYKTEGKRVYDELVLKKLLDSFTNNDKYQIILKPHPRNEPVVVYQNLINNYNCTNFLIIQGNLLELIYISDILISIESTTLIDSTAMGKIAVAVLFGESSKISHKDNEIILSCSLDTLPQTIHKVLFDESSQQTIRKNQVDFIRENYNIFNENPTEVLKSIF